MIELLVGYCFLVKVPNVEGMYEMVARSKSGEHLGVVSRWEEVEMYDEHENVWSTSIKVAEGSCETKNVRLVRRQ